MVLPLLEGQVKSGLPTRGCIPAGEREDKALGFPSEPELALTKATGQEEKSNIERALL